jgi:hypothetical protein
VEGLPELEIRELARCFPDLLSARQVLEAAGWSARQVPSWLVTTADQFWREVSSLLSRGTVPDGRRRLIAAALDRYSGNPVFAVGVGTTAGLGRLVPPRDLLPMLPARFVARTTVATSVRTMLCHGSGSRVVGVVGMGGTGKSTLAAELVREPAVAKAFPDGAAWIPVGQHPDITGKLAETLRLFGDMAPVVDKTDGTRRLRDLLVGARALIVLDDVWNADVLEAFAVPAGVRLLVTARSRDAIFDDSSIYELTTTDEETSRRVLASYAHCLVTDLPAAADLVVQRCGGLVLALALVGAMVGAGRRWETVAERLRRADLATIRALFPGYPHPTLLAALDVSVNALSDIHAQRFRELAVFDGRGAVPAAVVVGLWQLTADLDDLDAEDVLDQLARHSLVRIHPVTRTVSLHNLLFDYVRGELTVQVGELHGELAAWLLDRWDGLPTSLRRLPPASTRDDVDRYALAEIVTHLLAADDPDTVDLLLAAERTTPAGRDESIWYTAHEDQGTTATYIATVRTAWLDARTRTSPDDPKGFSRQAGYALLISSITSKAASIPSELFVRLVETDTWKPARALAYAQAIPAPTARAEALTCLLPHLTPDERVAVVAQAWAAIMATDVELSSYRVRTVTALAPYLPADLLREALDTAALFKQQGNRAEVLTSILPYLPPGNREAVFDQAVTAASTIEWPPRRALALARLASHLAPEQRGPIVTQALAFATAIDDPRSRITALVNLLTNVPPGKRAPVLAEALTAVNSIAAPHDRAEALTGLAPFLPDGERGLIVAQALAAATSTHDHPSRRAEVVAGLAPHLPPPRARTDPR